MVILNAELSLRFCIFLVPMLSVVSNHGRLSPSSGNSLVVQATRLVRVLRDH